MEKKITNHKIQNPDQEIQKIAYNPHKCTLMEG